METTWDDIRLALRSYARTPSFLFVTIATLAIGIGATTTIFSVIQGVLLAPLPYDEPARIVEVGKWSPNFDRLFALSAPDVLDVQERNHSFEALAASGLTRLTILGDGEPQILRGAMVFPDFFAVLGVQPTLGRSFTAAEDAAATPVAVLSHGLWQRRWGGDSALVGNTITLNETPFTVVGIMPPDFRPPQAIGQANVELWIPFAFVNEESKNQRHDAFLQVIGRLHQGVSHASAQSELLALSARLTEEFPDAGERSFGLSPLHRETVGGSRGTLLPLFGAVSLLLIIAWTNVANLVLLRASARGHEIALRVAIGASRSRIVRQHLTESLMLGLAGGVLGVGIAWVGVRIFVAFDPGDIPRLSEVSVNGSVLGFAMALSVLTSVTVGLVPALRSSRPDLANGLKEGAKGAGTSLKRERLRNGLVIAETSLAFVLVVGAGLLINSFVRLHRVETGFDPEAIYAISVAYPSDESANVPTFYDEVMRRVDALPGVTAAGATTTLPLSGDRAMQSLTVEGLPVPADEGRYSVNYHLVTADFFATLGISLLRGRGFDDSDGPATPLVVVVNEAMTRDLFGDGDPIGRRLSLGERGLKEGWFEIVGVVANIRQMGLAEAPVPELYFSFDQIPRRQMHVLARTEAPNPQILTAMREAVWSVRPDVPIRRSILMSDFAAQSIIGPRFYTLLLGSFAGVALLLALVGIYGTLAHTVSQRAHELGVRMALGATGGSVLRMILGRAMALVVFGVILGIGAAVLVTRTLESFVFGVTPTDTTTMALGVATVLVAAFLASVVPAWRATRIDPIVTLGRE